MKPTFFATPAAFGRWLKAHHARETELWVGFHKVGSGKPSMRWPESVDEALRFGWIDGLRKSFSDEAYVIRFSPRRTTSIWSTVNMRKVEALIAAGRMAPAGMKAWAERREDRSEVYAFERKAAALSPAEVATFRKRPKAWKFWETQPAGYRRLTSHWVSSAKRPETRAKRFATLLADSAAGLRIASQRRTPR